MLCKQSLLPRGGHTPALVSTSVNRAFRWLRREKPWSRSAKVAVKHLEPTTSGSESELHHHKTRLRAVYLIHLINAAVLRWMTWTPCQGLEGRTREQRKRNILLNSYTTAWVKPYWKAQGRLAPSHSAVLNPSSWSRSHHPARLMNLPGCPPVTLLRTPPVTRRCCSASSSWTVTLPCNAASPWRTHPGRVNDMDLITVVSLCGKLCVRGGSGGRVGCLLIDRRFNLILKPGLLLMCSSKCGC